MRVVYWGRVLFDVNSSTEIGHTGMQVATGSGVLRLIDNEDKSSDGGNPRVLLTVMENSIDKVTSYSQVVWQNMTVEGNSWNYKNVKSAYERR